MTETSKLLQLANTIQQQVSEIQRHLVKTGQPDPSFDEHAMPTNYDSIDDTRSDVLDNLTLLKDQLLTPRELLQEQWPTDFLSRHAIDRFKIIQAVPLNASKTYEQLASDIKLPVKTVRRLVRHSISQRVFCECKPGEVSHNQASKLLAENEKVRDYFGTVTEEVWPAATRTCDAIAKWPFPKDRSESGYQLAHGRTIYETLAEDPVKQARYDSAMGAYASDRSFSFNNIINNYDWAGLGEATVVDVGGGIGNVSKTLAKNFPLLHFVVEDQPQVLVKASLDDEPELKDRVKFLEHDFFTAQPVKDAAVYFLRRVLMDWPDEKGTEIIRALKPALKKGARVVIQDAYEPAPGSMPLWQERKFRSSDMLSLALSGGERRDVEEWRTMFESAGPGYKFLGVKNVPATDVVFVEAEWEGEDVNGK